MLLTIFAKSITVDVWSSFDAIKYVRCQNILDAKTLKVAWCSWQYFEFTEIFHCFTYSSENL